MSSYNFEKVYAGLKDFQRATVEHVFRRLYTDPDATRRFLVADEVGLGKTLVARGVIARAIEHLEAKGVERIDVVYVCSNAAIARQNVQRLNVSEQKDFSLPDRITLLPLHIKQLSRSSLNFISFTPGTALDLKDQGGTFRERALLYWMLRWAWGDDIFDGVRPFNVFQGSIQRTEWWRRYVRHEFPTDDISRDLARAFKKGLAEENRQRLERGEVRLQQDFRELLEIFTRADKNLHWKERAQRNRFIGRLRALLARTCINELQPDLIILDEFQRFRHLLDGSDPAAELAQALFDYEDARVLLLSATPYKMYTLTEESDSDNHYEDFLRTTRFLSSDSSADFARELSAYRSALLHLSEETLPRAIVAKEAVEALLKKIMSRTERLSITPDRSGMLREVVSDNVQIHPGDVRAFITMQQVASVLDAGDMLEYWKSAPYLLNFMEGYKVALSLNDAHLTGHTQEVAKHLADGASLLPHWDRLRAWQEVDPMNARLRALTTDAVDSGMWRLLWMPPSLPYYEPGGPYAEPGVEKTTKRLVFSAWAVVPKAIASLVSYEVERRMVGGGQSPRYLNDPDSRRTIRPLLRFQHTSDRGLQGMSLLALIYPSFSLARMADPLKGLRTEVTSRRALLDATSQEIERRLHPLIGSAERSGGIDERWYWAAPLLLDAGEDAEATHRLLSSVQLAEAWMSEVAESETVEQADAAHTTEPVSWAETRVGETYVIRRTESKRRYHVYTVVRKSQRTLTVRKVTADGTWRKTSAPLELHSQEIASIHSLDPNDPRRGPTPELMKAGNYYAARLGRNTSWITYFAERVLHTGVVLRPAWRVGAEQRIEHGHPRTKTWDQIDGSVYPDARFGTAETGVGGLIGDVLARARDVLGNPAQLGEPPGDLPEVLARMALASPAICGLRALSRVSSLELHDEVQRGLAAGIAWSFRNLFNLPDVSTMLRSEGEDAFWQVVLRYCLDGNLQAVLDEYAHVLPEWLGLLDKDGPEVAESVAETISESMGLRAVPYAVDDIQSDGSTLTKERHRLRGRFAVRFGDEKSDEGAQLTRSSHVRNAFNSPFWPFVLATTSVGQEGLDFHLYCHAVVHWNLPSNPVDLEQREGRVHRYKGHAVRKNLATAYSSQLNGAADPWADMFNQASRSRAQGESELFPYWLLPLEGGASIERIVPILPLSREQTRLTYLHKTLAAYRLVFGQPRQDDLVQYLDQRLGSLVVPLLDQLRIDLSPTVNLQRLEMQISPPGSVTCATQALLTGRESRGNGLKRRSHGGSR